MFKRMILKASALLLCVVVLTQGAAALQKSACLGRSLLDKGIVEYRLEGQDWKKCKLMIEKGDQKYIYDLKNGVTESYPLQLGNGSYRVTLMENTTDNRYREVRTDLLNLELDRPNDVFLGSIQNIKWCGEDPAVLEAEKLVSGKEDVRGRIEAIYEFITTHLTYDPHKAKTVSSGYLPDINETYESGKGICYDYTSLMAAMLRSVGIPAKLVMGARTSSEGVYHAWNEVYDADVDEWLVLDPTLDAPLKKSGADCAMVKNPADYRAEKIY